MVALFSEVVEISGAGPRCRKLVTGDGVSLGCLVLSSMLSLLLLLVYHKMNSPHYILLPPLLCLSKAQERNNHRNPQKLELKISKRELN